MPSPELRARLSAVCLVIFDVDGVLTDGSLQGGDQGGRRWSVADGFASTLARQAGLGLALCSGRDHPEIRDRAAALHIGLMRLGRLDKAAAVREILAEAGVPPGAALFVGDDLMDWPAMARVGLAAVPADARPELRERADWVLAAPGGRGAAREVIEAVLKAKGLWAQVTRPFLEPTDA